jgi:FPC/CPF motif-containing protein YcgG
MHRMNTTTHNERQATASIADALQALQRAIAASDLAGYGSMVLGPLDDARKAAQYALDVVEGRV